MGLYILEFPESIKNEFLLKVLKHKNDTTAKVKITNLDYGKENGKMTQCKLYVQCTLNMHMYLQGYLDCLVEQMQEQLATEYALTHAMHTPALDAIEKEN